MILGISLLLLVGEEAPRPWKSHCQKTDASLDNSLSILEWYVVWLAWDQIQSNARSKPSDLHKNSHRQLWDLFRSNANKSWCRSNNYLALVWCPLDFPRTMPQHSADYARNPKSRTAATSTVPVFCTNGIWVWVFTEQNKTPQILLEEVIEKVHSGSQAKKQILLVKFAFTSKIYTSLYYYLMNMRTSNANIVITLPLN